MAKDKGKIYTHSNFHITKIYKGPDGTKQYGKKTVPWQILNFYTDHEKAVNPDTGKGIKFTLFVNPDETETHPYEDVKVAKMEFTIKPSGEFTNYNVEKIEYVQGNEPSKATANATTAEYVRDAEFRSTTTKENKPDSKPEPQPESQPKSKPEPESTTALPPRRVGLGKESPIWFCTRYATDIMIAKLKTGIEISMTEAESEIARAALSLYKDLQEGLEQFQNGRE